MESLPVWFGATARPLFGWHHHPDDGSARATVVLCAPIGSDESSHARMAFIRLAEILVEARFAVLRFDYDGTGDSAGDWSDPGRLGAWEDSIRQALGFARASGARQTILLGMRMGAIFARRVAGSDPDLDALVLWDPCISGRSFLRQQRALVAASYDLEQAEDGSVIGLAFVFGPEVVDELSSLDLRAGPEGPSRSLTTLVLTRDSTSSKDRVAALLEEPGVTWMEVPGQSELLDSALPLSKMAESDLEGMVAWLDSVIDRDEGEISVQTPQSAVVGTSAGGPDIVEQVVWLGSLPLFAMETAPVGHDDHPATVVFLSAGLLDHSGPGRLWTDLARGWAAAGICSLRVDLSGVGDSGVRPGQPRYLSTPPEAIDDMADIVSSVSPGNPSNLVLVGLSSGGYHALEAGLRQTLGAACVINGGISGTRAEEVTGSADPRRNAYRPMAKPFQKLAVKHRRIAIALWKATTNVMVGRAPIGVVCSVAARGTRVLWISSGRETEDTSGNLYWWLIRRRLERKGLLEFHRLAGEDHSAYTPETRKSVESLLSHFVLRHFTPSPG